MRIDRERLLTVLDRAHTGPIMESYEWDTRVIPRTIRQILKKYDLQKTCDPANPISMNDELADRFFQAGLEAAEEIGLLCTDTHRVIKFSRDELLHGLDAAPAEFTIGENGQEVTFKHRNLNDATKPVWVCPLSIAVTEDVFLPLVEGIAREETVDCIEGPSLETVYGQKVRAGSPLELMVGKYQAELNYEALKRAGREGMPMYCVGTSPTHYGMLGGYGMPGGFKPGRDIVLMLSPVEMKTTYELLHRLVQMYNCGDAVVYGGSWSMIGGYAGGPEGATLSCIACTILLYTAYQAANGASFPYDMKYMGNCGRDALWALGVVFQALSRNTHLCVNSVLNQTSGPVTNVLLYESAVGMMNLAVSGATSCTGTRTAGGRFTNFITPLEIRFAGEVFKGCAGMSREQANDIANKLLPRYEGRLMEKPAGKSFLDCYDLKTLQPSDEWLKLYEQIKNECISVGMPLS
jgi:methylamine---corrinoid protein Co-methyltransferase